MPQSYLGLLVAHPPLRGALRLLPYLADVMLLFCGLALGWIIQ